MHRAPKEEKNNNGEQDPDDEKQDRANEDSYLKYGTNEDDERSQHESRKAQNGIPENCLPYPLKVTPILAVAFAHAAQRLQTRIDKERNREEVVSESQEILSESENFGKCFPVVPHDVLPQK